MLKKLMKGITILPVITGALIIYNIIDQLQ